MVSWCGLWLHACVMWSAVSSTTYEAVHRDNMMHMYDGPVPGFAVRAVIHYSIVSNKTENDYYDILGIPRASLVVFWENTTRHSWQYI